MLFKDVKMEPRGDQDPKFNMKNKTDRKIFFAVLISIVVLLAIIAGLVVVYYKFFTN